MRKNAHLETHYFHRRLAPSLLPEMVNVQEESVDSGASAARKPSAVPERSEAKQEFSPKGRG